MSLEKPQLDFTATKEQLEERLLEIRRNLHREPELSNEEYETTRKLKGWLKEAGIKVLDLPALKTGVIAEIGSGEGPIVALRADIDALPIDEQSGVPFSSTVPGKMHACGHDFHTTVALGAAYLLKEREEELAGTVRIVFQPAEETGHGAKDVLASGGLDNVAVIFGLHNDPDLEVGELGTCAGPITAGVDRFEIVINGVGAHAASPEKGTDTIVAASQIVLALQTISSRLVSALDSIVVSVTRITGGNTWNVLPATVELEGTVRTLNVDVQKRVPEQIRQILAGIGAAAGVTAELRWYPGPLATINDAFWSEFAAEAARETGYKTKVLGPSMGGEDFSFYLQDIPGAFVYVGSSSSYALHHPKFAPNESAILPAAEYYSHLAVRAINELSQE
ncbi:amidohydrolase [Paenibacillus phoenicis]|jgi:amidohydrolase|uniref:Amidohydrolase n=1 Tax=Paenibacillus phoenicis TaxID=554117 RepID=A0ABU5PRD4_9BACL|nr:amidohydrolase [Paenibacillus phoenicis]MEA3572485.1 amidohydrolase [Paenibacillus phoenicis]